LENVSMLARSLAALAAALLTAPIAAEARAVVVPFVEDFPDDAAGWRDSGQLPVAWQASGGPDGSSHVSAELDYFGFEAPFGGGPVVFRANDAADASGDAFVGDWISAGVGGVRAWVRHDTGEDLTFFLRLSTPANFPGAVIDDDEAVPSGVWTQIEIEIDPETCESESGGGCDDILNDVGNLQIGTLPSEALTMVDMAFTHDLDQVELLPAPEPAQAALAAAGALVLAAARRRRSARA
jgi:hypothetical protein